MRKVIHSIPGIEIVEKKDRINVYFRKRFVGFIKEGIFHKIVKKKNIYRKWNSVGIELAILDYLRSIGIDKIKIKIRGQPYWYVVEVKDFFFSDLELEYAGYKQKHLRLEEIRTLSKHRWFEDMKEGGER